MKHVRLLSLLLIPASIIGCGSKDTDPNAKINAPGYYNGPMNGKGASEEAPKKPVGATAD
ncbi:hypothetical protein EON79_10155 [bacterium]|nr:MAG: hypothetical protein EON79_10155 [bacterium]